MRNTTPVGLATAIVTLVGATTLTVGNVFQEMIEVNLTPGARTTLHLVLRTDSPDADEDAAEPAPSATTNRSA